ncbi:protein DpdD [Sulfurovum sp.]|uniref:protein DpdD n=1 Tax=Sulfurovum sp. TaxID=1969726 RepID=UPI003563B4D2
MIHQKQTHSDTIYEGLDEELSLSPAQKQLLVTVKDKKFPGAIIPTEEVYYIVSSSEKEWRLLLPMIRAFLSPSVVDSSCAVKYLNEANPVDKVLTQLGLKCVLKVPVPSTSIGGYPATKVYEKIFNRMYDLYKQTVFHQVSYPEHTSVIIERFKKALKFNDSFEALSCMEQIKHEQRLDALNIIFLEIEYFYTFRDWQGILEIDQLDQVMITRKPLRIRMHLIEAFYYTYIENELTNEKRVAQLIQRYMLSLLSVPCPANAIEVVQSVYMLAAKHDLISSELISNIIERTESLEQDEEAPVNDVDIALVRAATIQAANEDTVASITKAQKQFEQLAKDKQEVVEETIENDVIIKEVSLPSSWPQWIERLSDDAFQVSREVAERGLEEWSLQEQLSDPIIVQALAKHIVELNDLGVSRFTLSIPDFLEAMYRDRHHPNVLYLPIFMSILELMSLNDVQDQNSLYITQDITTVILQMGPSVEQYTIVMEFVEIIIEGGNGKSFINWLLDYAELLISENAKDEQLRNSILEKILNKIYDQREWLEKYHLKLIIKLASTIHLEELFSDISFEKEDSESNPWEKYVSKTIGIYTLSENAARHAKEYLEENISNVRVLLNHDKAATEALRHLAKESDFLVLVTQSAKHAASGEIQKILRQKNEKPLFPIGKGSSSIIAKLLEG